MLTSFQWLEDKKSENGGAENGFDEDNPKPSTSRSVNSKDTDTGVEADLCYSGIS